MSVLANMRLVDLLLSPRDTIRKLMEVDTAYSAAARQLEDSNSCSMGDEEEEEVGVEIEDEVSGSCLLRRSRASMGLLLHTDTANMNERVRTVSLSAPSDLIDTTGSLLDQMLANEEEMMGGHDPWVGTDALAIYCAAQSEGGGGGRRRAGVSRRESRTGGAGRAIACADDLTTVLHLDDAALDSLPLFDAADDMTSLLDQLEQSVAAEAEQCAAEKPSPVVRSSSEESPEMVKLLQSRAPLVLPHSQSQTQTRSPTKSQTYSQTHGNLQSHTLRQSLSQTLSHTQTRQPLVLPQSLAGSQTQKHTQSHTQKPTDGHSQKQTHGLAQKPTQTHAKGHKEKQTPSHTHKLAKVTSSHTGKPTPSHTEKLTQSTYNVKPSSSKPPRVSPTAAQTVKSRLDGDSNRTKDRAHSKSKKPEPSKKLRRLLGHSVTDSDSDRSNGARATPPIGAKPSFGTTPTQAKSMGATPTQGKTIGATPTQAKPMGATPTQVKTMGATPTQGKKMGASPTQAKPMGATPTQAKPIGATPTPAKPMGATHTQGTPPESATSRSSPSVRPISSPGQTVVKPSPSKMAATGIRTNEAPVSRSARQESLLMMSQPGTPDTITAPSTPAAVAPITDDSSRCSTPDPSAAPGKKKISLSTYKSTRLVGGAKSQARRKSSYDSNSVTPQDSGRSSPVMPHEFENNTQLIIDTVRARLNAQLGAQTASPGATVAYVVNMDHNYYQGPEQRSLLKPQQPSAPGSVPGSNSESVASSPGTRSLAGSRGSSPTRCNSPAMRSAPPSTAPGSYQGKGMLHNILSGGGSAARELERQRHRERSEARARQAKEREARALREKEARAREEARAKRDREAEIEKRKREAAAERAWAAQRVGNHVNLPGRDPEYPVYSSEYPTYPSEYPAYSNEYSGYEINTHTGESTTRVSYAPGAYPLPYRPQPNPQTGPTAAGGSLKTLLLSEGLEEEVRAQTERDRAALLWRMNSGGGGGCGEPGGVQDMELDSDMENECQALLAGYSTAHTQREMHANLAEFCTPPNTQNTPPNVMTKSVIQTQESGYMTNYSSNASAFDAVSGGASSAVMGEDAGSENVVTTDMLEGELLEVAMGLEAGDDDAELYRGLPPHDSPPLADLEPSIHSLAPPSPPQPVLLPNPVPTPPLVHRPTALRIDRCEGLYSNPENPQQPVKVVLDTEEEEKEVRDGQTEVKEGQDEVREGHEAQRDVVEGEIQLGKGHGEEEESGASMPNSVGEGWGVDSATVKQEPLEDGELSNCSNGSTKSSLHLSTNTTQDSLPSACDIQVKSEPIDPYFDPVVENTTGAVLDLPEIKSEPAPCCSGQLYPPESSRGGHGRGRGAGRGARNYRKRARSPNRRSPDEARFDKLPAYCTALSLGGAAVAARGRAVKASQLLERDLPARDRDPSPGRSGDPLFNKLPAYISSFANSTRYDAQDGATAPGLALSDEEGSPARAASPKGQGVVAPMSPSRLIIASQPGSASNSRANSPTPPTHSRNASPTSLNFRPSRPNSPVESAKRDTANLLSAVQIGSRPGSRTQSQAGSRAGSPVSRGAGSRIGSPVNRGSRIGSPVSRAGFRLGSPVTGESRVGSPVTRGSSVRSLSRIGRRRSYSSDSSRSSRSRSWSRSRSRSPLRRRRSRSHYRSRSRARVERMRGERRFDRGPRRHDKHGGSSRSGSRERWKCQDQSGRKQEKEHQMEERRIVYVGGIGEDCTRAQLRTLFSVFGEIEETNVMFRERGDNYGFVTFRYTCDAYAAIERGNKVSGCEGFDLCFGGRRHFCRTKYEDLDGNMEEEEELGVSRGRGEPDFDELLNQALKEARSKR